MKKLNNIQNLKNILTKVVLKKEYIDNCKSQKKIAEEYKVSRRVVNKYMKDYNIKARTFSELTSGKNNPMFGIRRFGESSPRYIDGKTNKKYYCIDCNKLISRYSGVYGQGRCNSCNGKYLHKIGKLNTKGRNNPRYNKKISKNTRRKLSLSHGGTGVPYENLEYPAEFFNIRKQIRKRDNYICQICSKTQKQNNRALDVHHIDYDKKNNKEGNLITLCQSCHMKTNANRNYWKKYFKESAYVCI